MPDEIYCNDVLLVDCESESELGAILSTLIAAKFNEDRRLELLQSPLVNRWIEALGAHQAKGLRPEIFLGGEMPATPEAAPPSLFSKTLEFLVGNRTAFQDAFSDADTFEEFIREAFAPFPVSDAQMAAAKRKFGSMER